MLESLAALVARPMCCASSAKVCVRAAPPEEVEGEAQDDSCPTTAGVAFPSGPVERTVPTFATEGLEQVSGETLGSGSILRLMLGESIQEMTLSLYVTGFTLTPCLPRGRTIARAWSPFSLVEKCQVKAMQDSAQWAVFKLTVFRREGMDLSYYFACTGSDAHKERDMWVGLIADAIGHVTVSLFPDVPITVAPLAGKARTSTRIMAGYLLQGGSADKVALLYGELHAYSGGISRMVLYKDHWCEQEVRSIAIADSSSISTRKGSYCTVFGVDQHRFCARTREEKELWLRAVSNVKVKLMFEAPEPTPGEIAVFRAAVGERVEALPPTPRCPRPPGTPTAAREPPGAVASFAASDAAPAPASPAPEAAPPAEPLLVRLPRKPPDGPRGDDLDTPEPVEEAPRPASGRPRAEAPHNSKVDGLEPEECRRLLKSISAKITGGHNAAGAPVSARGGGGVAVPAVGSGDVAAGRDRGSRARSTSSPPQVLLPEASASPGRRRSGSAAIAARAPPAALAAAASADGGLPDEGDAAAGTAGVAKTSQGGAETSLEGPAEAVVSAGAGGVPGDSAGASVPVDPQSTLSGAPGQEYAL